MEYSGAAWEQAMRMQDVILRAMSREIRPQINDLDCLEQPSA